MAVETLEAPLSAPADPVAFEAEAKAFIDQHLAPEPAATEQVEPTDSPLPADSSAVEPTEAEASEATATPPVTTAGEAKPNAPVPPPASWQPDEVARQAARNLGLSDEVVRDIRTPEEFYRTLQIAAAVRTPPAAPSPVPDKPKEPTALEKFLNDPLQDQDMVAAVRSVVDRNAQVEQQVQQLSQGTQAQQQHVVEQHRQKLVKEFDSVLDGMNVELFGKSDALSNDHVSKREAVWNELVKLANSGVVKDVSPVSVELAMFAARPEEFKEQLRRQVVSDAHAKAKSQSSQRLTVGDGRSTAPAAAQDHPVLDKALIEAGKAAGLSL